MNIYFVDRKVIDYETYDSFVCYAETEEEARYMHPSDEWKDIEIYQNWCDKKDCKNLIVSLLGEAKEQNEAKVILASYNAS